jgi:integrase
LGRSKGRKTKGFFYRTGRGWYSKDGSRFIPLRYENGEHIKLEKADERDIKEAYARFLLDKQRKPAVQDATTVLEVVKAYLADTKQNGAAKTHADRADTLFDFCFGIPPEYRNRFEVPEFQDAGKEGGTKRLTKEEKLALKKKLIHEGYGGKAVAKLIAHDVTNWLNAHHTWSAGGRRSRIQAVKRALNYAVEQGLIKKNPIRGFRTPRPEARVTYITPEQEMDLLSKANPAMEIALRVCIRTGARPGTEFAAVTRKHVKLEGERMVWVFSPGEIKNRRERRIFITDPEIIGIVKGQMQNHPEGPIFRNTLGKPWNRKSLSLRFRTIRDKLIEQGIEFDEDCCMYSCRHTYAKRTLEGHWSGKPCNIETLARLMGNSPQVCREHYLRWSTVDNDPIWEVA